MKGSYKRFRNFSKLLYNKNLGQTQYIRSSKTFDKNSSFKRDNSSSNLIKPEIEYVTKLNFFEPKSPILEKKKTLSSVENKILENKLENKRKELENKIFQIKQDLKLLNEELIKTISEIDNLKLDFEILQNNKTCSIIEKNLKKSIVINSIFSPKREGNSLPFLLNKNNTLQGKYKIDSILSKHKKDMKSKKNLALMKLAQLKEQKKELIKKIKSNENELKNLREENNKIKSELLSHYHNILHEGKDIRKDGLSWVIQAIWNLKSKVLPSYLPNFLDQESIEFLFNFSTQKNKLKEMYKTFQKISQTINENKNNLNINFSSINSGFTTIDQDSISKESDTTYNAYNTYELEEIKEKNDKWLVNAYMDKINKKFCFNNDFFTTRSNSLLIKKKSFLNIKANDLNINNLKNNSSLNKVLLNKIYKEAYELSNTKKVIEKKIYKLKNEIKNMIEKELKHLNNYFYKEGYEAKYNIDDKYKIIFAVIGEENARNYINKQINESKKFLSILRHLRKGKSDS